MQVSIEDIRNWGIVGAGGAGFPTYVKAGSQTEKLIINAAECEPLLYKDKEILRNFPNEFFEGIRLMMNLVKAKEGIIAIKEKYGDVIEKIRLNLPSNIRIHLMGDYYPAGDEFILVFDATGRIIPPGRLPLDVGCVVDNVETILNIGRKQPVTKKYLTVGGAVKKPSTICVPIGVSFKECIDLVGGAAVENPSIIAGGVMMGQYCENGDGVVTKTTGGLIVLPYDHPVARRYRRSSKAINIIGKSCCDQCCYCTEYCPRYLLGHPIQPHLVMRSLGLLKKPSETMVIGTLFCCECNLCSLFACPEDLDPKNICVENKTKLRKMNAKWTSKPSKSHPLIRDRRVPLKRLFAKLSLKEFENKGPLLDKKTDFKKVRLLLKQGLGAPAEPIVRVGDKVKEGNLIAKAPRDKLSVPLHSSISGVVRRIDSEIVIET